MLFYLKYIIVWLFFMVLIAGLTLLVPKIAKSIEKARAAQKEQEEQPQDEPEEPKE